MLGYQVATRRLGWKKIGFRFELSTLSMVIWWFNKRYTIHRYKGSREDPLLRMVRRMGWKKVGNLA